MLVKQKQHLWIKVKMSRSVMSDYLQPHGHYSQWNSPVQNTGVGSLSFLQEIFTTERSNPGVLHCRRILKVVVEHTKAPGFLTSRGKEFNLGPETRLERSGLLCNKVLLKYKRDRESF